MPLPPSPPGRSPTIAYEPAVPPSQLRFVIIGTIVVTSMVLAFITLVGKRPFAWGLPAFIGLDIVLVWKILRGGVSVGRDWLQFERFVGTTWVDLTHVRKLAIERNSRGVDLTIEDERGTRATLPLEQLQRSPLMWKTLRRAIATGSKHAVSVDELSREVLDL